MAEKFGYPDPDRLLRELPARTLEEWRQYFKVRSWEMEQSSKKKGKK